MQYWLVKTEPEEYSFNDLLRDKHVVWDGVRNYQARNNLKKMKKSDLVLVYHTGKNKEIVGVSEVYKESYQDPNDKENMWIVVELKPYKRLEAPVSLAQIKKEKPLLKLPLLKQSRLSVMPVSRSEFEYILKLSGLQ